MEQTCLQESGEDKHFPEIDSEDADAEQGQQAGGG